MPDSITADSGAILNIPLADLRLDEINVRKDHRPDPELIASLGAVGLLQPLLVQEIGYDGDAGAMLWSVVDGGRRYVSILKGIEDGVLPGEEWQTVQCRRVRDGHHLKELSLHANLHQAMHPLDACEAIRELARTEDDVDKIARHFGQTTLWVAQRAKLGALTEKARRVFRDGGMGMDTAILMTRLSDKQQDKLARHKQVTHWMVKQEINSKAIDANAAIFDWEADYPADKIQRSLFGDVTLLTDLALFDKLQAKAIKARIEAYKAEGYSDVIDLRGLDQPWRTRDKYVALEGKATAAMKDKLVVLVDGDLRGIRFLEDMIPAALARSIRKGKEGGVATAKAPVALTAADLSQPQKQIVSATWAAAMVELIVEGEPDERLLQFIVFSHMLVEKDEWTGWSASADETVKDWEHFAKSYPKAMPDLRLHEAIPLHGAGLSFKQWLKMKPGQRDRLWRWAVAAMIRPVGMRKVDPETYADSPIRPIDWLRKLDRGFFEKYRGDQLLDYIERSGVKKGSGQMPIDARKESRVACAMAALQNQAKPYLFGIDEKPKARPPAEAEAVAAPAPEEEPDENGEG